MGPPPFPLVVAKSMLRTRNAEQPDDTSVSELNACTLPEDILSYASSQVILPSDSIEAPQDIDPDDDEYSEFEDDGTEDIIARFDISQLENNATVSSSQPQVEQISSSSIESIAREIIQSEFNITQLTQAQQEELVTLLTQILEDIFPVENRLLHLLLQDHSAFAFTQAIFVYDRDDKAEVEKVLQSHNMT